jgi:CRISPR-associated endonuclease Cas1
MPTRSHGWAPGVGAVCVVDGYGSRVSVERGHLRVEDGIRDRRREVSFSRATHGLRRLVVLGSTGSISLEALRWLADLEIGFVHLARDGRLLAASAGMGLDDPRLRRAQAAAWNAPTGMTIARELLRRKLAGQARIAERLGASDVVAQIERIAPALEVASTPAELLIPEAAAALAYWSAWALLNLRWARADQSRIPDHWRTVGGRASPITGNSRSAANPANALLNYVYALLEAEARLACIAMGLDPGLGVLHADQRARDSLALDVMEAVRPDVDSFVLDLLARRTFRRADFFETRQGVCRILPPLTHELASSMPVWAARLGPVVEWVAKALSTGAGAGTRRVPTLLTGANRSEGRTDVRRGAPRSAIRAVAIARSCRTCGGSTPVRGRDYCDTCLPEVTGEQRAAFVSAGLAELRSQREAGVDPSHGGDAGQRRGAKIAASRRAAADWERSNGPAGDPELFRLQVLPLIRDVPAANLAGLTGLSRPYCSAILRGDKVPHARWWATFQLASARDRFAR